MNLRGKELERVTVREPYISRIMYSLLQQTARFGAAKESVQDITKNIQIHIQGSVMVALDSIKISCKQVLNEQEEERLASLRGGIQNTVVRDIAYIVSQA